MTVNIKPPKLFYTVHVAEVEEVSAEHFGVPVELQKYEELNSSNDIQTYLYDEMVGDVIADFEFSGTTIEEDVTGWVAWQSAEGTKFPNKFYMSTKKMIHYLIMKEKLPLGNYIIDMEW
jgi:hypothetical protein